MMEDFLAYKGLFIERGILLATSNNGEIDLFTPSGVLTATIKTAVSEHEIAMMRTRMKRVARQKAEQGVPKWTTAFGYLDTSRIRLPRRWSGPPIRLSSAARRSPPSPSGGTPRVCTGSAASRGRPPPSACSCARRATPVCGRTTARSWGLVTGRVWCPRSCGAPRRR